MATFDQQYDLSKKEKELVLKRAALRDSLKQEFMKKVTNPARFLPGQPGYVFDPAIQRYMSMRATKAEYFKPTMNGFIRFLAGFALPFSIMYYYVQTNKNEFERQCRSGEIPYRDRKFKLTV